MGKNILQILNSVCEGWVPELRFDSLRRFKFDYGNLKMKIAIEMEGGIYTGTGHVKIGTYLKDMQKYNLAQLKGWIVLRYGYGQENQIANDVIKAIEKRQKDKEKIRGNEMTKQNIKYEKNGVCVPLPEGDCGSKTTSGYWHQGHS